MACKLKAGDVILLPVRDPGSRRIVTGRDGTTVYYKVLSTRRSENPQYYTISERSIDAWLLNDGVVIPAWMMLPFGV